MSITYYIPEIVGWIQMFLQIVPILPAIQITLKILQGMVFIDVILSWFILIGLRIYLMPIRWILDPLYARIDKILPTAFLGISFTPFLLLMAIYMLQALNIFFAQLFDVKLPIFFL